MPKWRFFAIDIMENPDHPYIINGKSMRDCAKFAMKQVDFYFTRKPERTDFLTTKHYNSFMSRAKGLGVKVKNFERENINQGIEPQTFPAMK